MEEMIINFAIAYGWELLLTAFSGIFLLGVLKFFKVFDKIPKEKRKYAYGAISSCLSIMASAIYLIIVGGFEIASFVVIAGAIYGLNQTMYSIYENSGLREAFRCAGRAFIHLIAGKEIEKAKQEIQSKEV